MGTVKVLCRKAEKSIGSLNSHYTFLHHEFHEERPSPSPCQIPWSAFHSPSPYQGMHNRYAYTPIELWYFEWSVILPSHLILLPRSARKQFCRCTSPKSLTKCSISFCLSFARTHRHTCCENGHLWFFYFGTSQPCPRRTAAESIFWKGGFQIQSCAIGCE